MHPQDWCTVIYWERVLIVGNTWRSDPRCEEERCLGLASRTELLTSPRNAVVTSFQTAEGYAPAKNETTLIYPSGKCTFYEEGWPTPDRW
jgi:hypothetical protein